MELMENLLRARSVQSPALAILIGLNCSGDPTSGSRISAADISAHTCIDEETIYSIGGVTIQEERRYGVTSYYTDSSCSTVSYIDYRLEATSVDWNCSTSGSNCQLLPDGHYGKITCITATNYSQFAASAFGTTPYMIGKRHYNSDCSVNYALIAFHADGSTINASNGFSVKFQLASDHYNETFYLNGEQVGSFSATFSELATNCIDHMLYDPYNAPTGDTPTQTPASTSNTTTGQGNDSPNLKLSCWALLLGFFYSTLL